MRTPWGMSDSVDNIYRDINHYGTPRHGGIAIPENFHKFLTKETVENLSENPEHYNKGMLWFEEDNAYLLPLLEIKASLGDLSEAELKKSLRAAIYYSGLEQVKSKIDHPLYNMIRDLSEDEDIDRAIIDATKKQLEEKLMKTPGAIACRLFIQSEDELLRNTRDIHSGDATDINSLLYFFESKGMREEFGIMKNLFDSGKLVITVTQNGDLYVEKFGGDKHIHVDQYEKGKITLIKAA